MKFYISDSKELLNLYELKEKYKSTISFSELTNEALNDFGIYVVKQATPQYNKNEEKIVWENDVIYNNETNEYEQKYNLVVLTEEEKNSKLEALKNSKKNEIRIAFEESFSNSKCTSSLGFTVDNRRSGTKFDKDNLRTLIDMGVFPISFKDCNGVVHSLTEDEANILYKEMGLQGLSLYHKKWELEASIDNTNTIEELSNIRW